MKTTKTLFISAVAVLASASCALADLVVNITGATAFRAAAHQSIITTLGGTGNVQYAYSTSNGGQATDISGADRAIFKGSVPGIGAVTVRASWSGSGNGVNSLANNVDVSVLKLDTPVSGAGVNGGLSSGNFELAPAQFAFSDVAQNATAYPTPTLDGEEVGVVPFVLLANKGSTGITNITSQQFAALYKGGFVPLSLFTGNAADAASFVIPTGRSNSSGTRITILAETGYGINTAVQQYQPTVAGGQITALGAVADSGFGSNSNVRGVLSATSGTGLPAVIGYLTLSDALASQTAGATMLSYNGVPFSEENVKNGSYTLWGYQWFFRAANLTSEEEAFRASFVNNIAPGLSESGAGIPIPEMNVERIGGDGGQVLPKQ